MAAAARTAADALRATRDLPGVPVPVTAQPASAVVEHAPAHEGPAKAMVPARQPDLDATPRGSQDGKPVSSSPPARPSK